MWQRDVYGLRVGAGPISGDDLDGLVFAQPLRHRGSFPPDEDLDGLAALQIDDDRSIVVTARDGPVINADYSRLVAAPTHGCPSQLTQHRIGTGAQPQRGSEPRCSFTSERIAKS